MRGFNSLNALNDILVSVGIPAITEEMVKTALAEGRPVFAFDYSNRPDRDEIKAKLEEAFNGGENAALFVDEAIPDAPEAPELPEFLRSLFGSLDPEDEVLEEELIPQSKLDAYIEMSCDQIALLTRQRDEARQAFADERKAHDDCHDNFDLVLQQARLHGHAESLAASQFNKPFDDLPGAYQNLLLAQAQATIDNLDSLSAGPQG